MHSLLLQGISLYCLRRKREFETKTILTFSSTHPPVSPTVLTHQSTYPLTHSLTVNTNITGLNNLFKYNMP